MRLEREHDTSRRQRFLYVSEVAEILRIDDMTVYRAIRAGQFPAVKIRGRYVVPAKALDSMEEAALTSNTMVDAADWAVVPTAGRLATGGSA